jgi:putative tricarboxylic transport membrane protein
VLVDIADRLTPLVSESGTRRSMLLRLADLKRHAGNLIRSSVIGTIIGILPGIGANIGSIVAYTAAKNISKRPEEFGHGSEEGIVASETANNATVCGALIPLITLGIPGSINDAILIGAFIIHNLQPGPLLFTQSPEIAYGIIVAALVANLFMFALMLLGVPYFVKAAQVSKAFLNPIILMFCFVGAFAVNNSMHGVWIMLIFGLVGFGLVRARVPLGPFVIGLVLAPIAEKYLRSALMHSANDWSAFLMRPISGSVLAVTLLVLCYALYREFFPGRRAARAATGAASNEAKP